MSFRVLVFFSSHFHLQSFLILRSPFFVFSFDTFVHQGQLYHTVGPIDLWMGPYLLGQVSQTKIRPSPGLKIILNGNSPLKSLFSPVLGLIYLCLGNQPIDLQSQTFFPTPLHPLRAVLHFMAHLNNHKEPIRFQMTHGQQHMLDICKCK